MCSWSRRWVTFWGTVRDPGQGKKGTHRLVLEVAQGPQTVSGLKRRKAVLRQPSSQGTCRAPSQPEEL